MNELFTELQKQYLKKLTTEYQSHNQLCDSLSIERNKRETFFNDLIKLTDQVDYVDKKGGFGNPNYFIKLKNVAPISQILINTGNNYGNINQSPGESLPNQEINTTKVSTDKQPTKNQSPLLRFLGIISENKLASTIIGGAVLGVLGYICSILKAKKIIP